jgi:hypothetical protein
VESLAELHDHVATIARPGRGVRAGMSGRGGRATVALQAPSQCPAHVKSAWGNNIKPLNTLGNRHDGKALRQSRNHRGLAGFMAQPL